MADNVIRFPDRSDVPGYDGYTCACGSAWFQPKGVTLDQLGAVTGLAHPITCVECGVEKRE